MSIPTDYDMNKILPVLQSFGVAPNQLGPDKLNELMSLSEHISDPSKITPEITQSDSEYFGNRCTRRSKTSRTKGNQDRSQQSLSV